jgi:hypothetical protein
MIHPAATGGIAIEEFAITRAICCHHPKDTSVQVNDRVAAGLHNRIRIATVWGRKLNLLDLALGVDQV